MPTPLAEWSASSIQIDAKLGAYLSPSVVADWRAYSRLVWDTLSLIFTRYEQSPLDVPGSPRIATLPAYKDVHRLIYEEFQPELNHFQVSRGSARRSIALRLPNEYGDVQVKLLKLEKALGTEVLAAHPAGYSTSAHDLLRDLVP